MTTNPNARREGGTRSVAHPDRHSGSHLGRILADLAVQLGLGSLSERDHGTRPADSRHLALDRTAVMTAYARIGRVVTAAVIATSCATLALGWLRRRRPEPIPVVRCPIHGIAYDTELDICPERAKTHPRRHRARREGKLTTQRPRGVRDEGNADSLLSAVRCIPGDRGLARAQGRAGDRARALRPRAPSERGGRVANSGSRVASAGRRSERC